MTRFPTDQPARDAIRTDFDHNMIVRAGAGSGKTTALVSRIVALMEHGEDPARIVAITFTIKAAAEMRGRLYQALDAAARAAEDEVLRTRLTVALGRADDVFVGTIHAFCARLLRQTPWAVGIPPDFRQIEDVEEKVLRQRFWSTFLASREADEGMQLLREAGCSNAMLMDLFGRMADDSNWLAYADDVSGPPDFTDALRAAEQIRDFLEGLTPAGTGPDGVQKALERMRVMAAASSDRAAYLALFTGMVKGASEKLDITLKHWSAPSSVMKAVRDGEPHDEVPIVVLDVIESVIRPALVEWEAYVHAAAIRVLSGAIDAYDGHRRRSGLLTYADLLRLAAELLGSSEEARLSAQQTARRILVDEFQDTDPTQARMLFYLASSSPDLADWSGSPLMPGRLLFVGDDKQSIYRFRRADFHVFARCERAILDQGGRSLSLTTNFRSSEALCEWVNTTLRPLFNEGEEQAPYEDLVAYQHELHERVLTWMQVPSSLKAADEVRHEARAIASLIRSRYMPSNGAGDILILVRRNSRIPVYVAELSRHGIPVTVSGGSVKGGTEVLADLSAVLGSLLEPGNELSCVAALTSIFVGASHADLLALRNAGGRFDWTSELPAGAPESIVNGFRVLSRCRELLENHAPHAALSAMAAEWGWWDLLDARPSAAVDVGVFLRILALFRRRQEESWDWIECAGELNRYRTGELDMSLHAIQTSGHGAVRIMTVHQAKGLEADVVFLSDPGREMTRTVESHTFTDGGGAHVVLPILEDSGFRKQLVFAPLRWSEWSVKERAFEASERVRLLYVACTRAKKELVVTTRDGGSEGSWDILGPALERAKAPVLDVVQQSESAFHPDVPGTGVDARGIDPGPSLRSALDRLARPTYKVVRPSDVDHEQPVGGREGSGLPAKGGIGGKVFGTAVHEAFERLVNARESLPDDHGMREWARQSLRTAGATLPENTDLEAVLACMYGFLTGPVWQQVLEADDVLAEVSFTTSVPRNDVTDVISGTADLALRNGKAWTLVDYKTDAVSAEELLDRYRGQIQTYVRCWNRMFTDETVHAVLWSTYHGTVVQAV